MADPADHADLIVRLPKDFAELETWIGEARDEGYLEGQADCAGAHAELWNKVIRWAESRNLLGEPDEQSGGYTSEQLFDAIVSHENELDQALIKTSQRIAKQQETITEAVKQISQLAREAGEAKGKLEMSEAAGVVEGWRERAEAAEARVQKLEEARAETIKHLDQARWQVNRLGDDLAGVNWQAVVGMMNGDVERARCAAARSERGGIGRG
jgi:flagellar biosynthesis/type III secretory pathway protein FliH